MQEKNYSNLDWMIHWSLPKYAPRNVQIVLINKINDAIGNGYKNIILEAGTGTGKSAIAATIASMYDDSYILTMTKQLQEQYLDDFGAILVEIKGRSNYKCNYKGTCDFCIKSEYNLAKCKDCDYLTALNLAKESENVLTNYDYFYYAGVANPSLNSRELLILDEAHNLERKMLALSSNDLNREYIAMKFGIDIFEPVMSRTKSVNYLKKEPDYWMDLCDELVEHCAENIREIEGEHKNDVQVTLDVFESDPDRFSNFNYVEKQQLEADAKLFNSIKSGLESKEFIIDMPEADIIRSNKMDISTEFKPYSVVDETNNPNDLHFYWKGKSYDDDFSLQDRLQRLYRDGMYKFLREDVTYIEDGEIDKAFRWVQNDLDATKRKIKEYFRQLKFFSDNDFSFISVHNKRLFKQNAEILRKVVKMLQDIRLRVVKEDESQPDDSNQNQLLGDLFEGFLNKGVKQNEGQFFTPMPIVRFIVSALPLEKIIKESPIAPYAIDYACGAGHFLTEYDFRIAEFAKKYHADIPLSEYYAHTVGIEKEYRLSKVTKVSAFMYGHDDTNVIYADALTHIKEVKDGTFSVLVANPPYAVSGFLETLSEKERKSYSLYNKDINLDKNNAIETFFMERSAQLMKAGGVAGIVLPVSVLTKDGIYTRAREVILKNFDIISLTKFDKNTFGKTNTSTITLFLRRKETNTPEAEHYYNRVECWFGNWHEADEVYKDIELLNAYCKHMGYDMEDYKQFLNGIIPDRLENTEIVQNYHDSFFGNQRNAMKGVCREAKIIRTKYKAKEKTATFKRLPEAERNRIANDAFYSFVKEIEKDKVYYFILAYNASCPVVIVNMPSGTSEGKKFLGYEWSDTKGNEGIKYMHVKKSKQHDEDEEEDGNAEDDDTMQQIRGINGIVTPLFNPANLCDEQKINSLIRKNFLGEEIEIPNELENDVTLGNLVEMLDFKSTAFKKELKTNVSLKVEVQSHYPIVKLKDYCDKINPSKEEIRDVAKDTVVSFVEMASLGFGKIDVKEDKTIAELSDGGYTYFKENDVLIAKISPSMENGKCGLATGLTNGLGLGSTEFHVIRGKTKEQAKFILEYLNREYIRNIAASNETGASGHRRVPEYFYAQLPIPNIPQNILEIIAEECQTIDESQKVCETRTHEIIEEMEDLRRNVTGESKRLKDIMSFASDRITYNDIAPDSFITTDNMLQNCEGVRSYNGKPEVQSIIKYRKGDILLSNIRPYLKKMWLADRDGCFGIAL